MGSGYVNLLLIKELEIHRIEKVLILHEVDSNYRPGQPKIDSHSTMGVYFRLPRSVDTLIVIRYNIM